MLFETGIQAVITKILVREGGFSDNPEDEGGPTHFGVTMPFALTWNIPWPPTQSDARDGYRRMMAGTKIDQLGDEPTLDLVSDSVVNSGTYGIKWLQKALAVVPDGGIGPKTLMAMADSHNDWHAIYISILKQRFSFYAMIVHDHPNQSTFISGWINRALEFLV